jgi:uncharacterized integral membrane protein
VRLRRPKVDGELREGFQPRVWIRLGALSLLVAYVVAFILENSHSVNVHFVIVTARASLIWVIFLCLAIGLAAGLVGSQLYRHRRRHRGQPGDPL